MRRTPCQESGKKQYVQEFLESSLLKETTAVSATISICVENYTIKSVSDFFRRSPIGKTSQWPCKDYLRGRTCNNSFCENGTLHDACFSSTRPRVVVGLGKSAHSHIIRLMNSRRKCLKRMMAKVLCYAEEGKLARREPVTDECHDRPGKPGKRSDKKLERGSSQCRSSDAQQLGCVF